MIRKKRELKIIIMLMILVFSTGCGNNGATEQSHEKVISSEKFEIGTMKVSLIGNAQNQLKQTANKSYKITESLTSLGSTTSKLENKNNPIVLTKGIYYKFNTSFVSEEVYPKGLQYQLTLLNDDSNESDVLESHTIAYGSTEELNETGEHQLSLEILLPSQIVKGNYLLLITFLNADLEKIVEAQKDIINTPEIGAMYVTVEENENFKLFEIVQSTTDKYIDLPNTNEFSNEYTNQETASAVVEVSNNSSETKTVEISAVLELETGHQITLGLLDSADGSIKDSIPYVLNGQNAVDHNNQEISLSYYLPESEYASLISNLPDLSIDLENDGLKGQIKWTIQTLTEEELLAESSTNEVLLSQYVANYNYKAPTFSKKLPTRSFQKTYAQNFINKGILFNYYSGVSMTKGNRKKIAINFNSAYGLQGLWSVPGVNTDIDISVNFYILNKKFTLIGLESKAGLSMLQKHPRLNAQGQTANKYREEGAKIVATVFNIAFYKEDSIRSASVSGTLSTDASSSANKTALNDTKKRSAKKKSFHMPHYIWHEKKTFLAQRFMAGPVPMRIAAGIEGSFEIITEAGLEGVGILVEGSTPLSIKVFLEGGVSLALAEAGVKGEFVLTETTGNASLRTGLVLSNANKLSFQIDAKATLNLNLIRGAFSIYAKTKTKIKWCKKKIVFKKVKYPCGLKWESYSFYFYKTPWVYRRNWTLLNKSIPVYTLPYSF